MFNSKFTIFIISILILCLILTGIYLISNNNIESDSNEQDNSNDTIMMPIEDENGNVRLVPVTDTTSEGSASGPNNSEVDSNITEHSEDVGVRPIIDENGNTQYVEARVYIDEGQATS